MLRIYAVLLELVRNVRPLVVELDRRDADLARQCRRALTSAPLNLAEGCYSPAASPRCGTAASPRCGTRRESAMRHSPRVRDAAPAASPRCGTLRGESAMPPGPD